ncbi:unnamed protein product, partial [Amoebophrya sp. A120]
NAQLSGTTTSLLQPILFDADAVSKKTATAPDATLFPETPNEYAPDKDVVTWKNNGSFSGGAPGVEEQKFVSTNKFWANWLPADLTTEPPKTDPPTPPQTISKWANRDKKETFGIFTGTFTFAFLSGTLAVGDDAGIETIYPAGPRPDGTEDFWPSWGHRTPYGQPRQALEPTYDPVHAHNVVAHWDSLTFSIGAAEEESKPDKEYKILRENTLGFVASSDFGAAGSIEFPIFPGAAYVSAVYKGKNL